MKRFLILLPLLFIATSFYAFPNIAQDVDVTDPSQLVGLLNVVIVFVATFVVNKLTPIAPTWLLSIAIPGLSALGGFLLNLIMPDTNFLLSFIFGFLSTFVYELQRQLVQGNRKYSV